MASRVMKTIFDVIGRDSGATATTNNVTNGLNRMNGAAMKSQAALNGTNAALAKTNNVMKNAAKMAIGGGLVAMGGGMTNLVENSRKYAAELEYEMATLKGISGATAGELDRLSKAAKQAGIETQFTPTEAVQGLQSLAQQGLTTQQQLDSLNSTLYLAGASGGKVGIADAAKLSTQVLKAFGLESSKAGITVDQLVKTTTMSGLAIEELTEAMQNASSGAISMGLGVQESMAALGLIKNIIPSAAMAGSAFQIMTQRLSMPMIQKKIRQTLGVDIIDSATGKYRDFGKILVEMSNKMAGMKEGQRGAFLVEAFGARAQKGMATIFKQLTDGVTTTTGEVLKGAKAFEYFRGALDKDSVAGFAKELNDLKLDTLNGQMELLNGSLQTFQIELGKGSAAISKSFVKVGLNAFNAFLTFFSNLPAPVKSAVSGFLTLSGTLLKVIGSFFILKGLMSILGLSLGGVLLTIGKIVLLAGPLTLLLSALGVGIYGVYRMISKNFGKAGDETATMFEKIKLGYRAIVDLISTGGLSEAVIKDMKQAKYKGVADFIGTFGEWMGKAKQFFRGVVDGFDQGLKQLIGPWQDFKDAVYDAFGGWFESSKKGSRGLDEWQSKGERFGHVLSGFSKTVLKIMTKAVELAGSFADWTSNITIDDVVDTFKTLAQAIQEVINGIRWLMDNNIITQVSRQVGDVANVKQWGAGVIQQSMYNQGKKFAVTPEQLAAGAELQARQMRTQGGVIGRTFGTDTGVKSNWYGFEGDVEKFVSRRAGRLETLRQTGLFQNMKQGTLADLQRGLVRDAQSAAMSKAEGKDKEAKAIEKVWDARLARLEAVLINAANKQGKLGALKLKIGEEEFGRIIDTAMANRDEGSYDSPEMGGAGTIKVGG